MILDRDSLKSYFYHLWYEKQDPPWFWRLVSYLYKVFIKMRRFDLKSDSKGRVLVIVVGNLTVGGTGKTPCIIYLTKLMQNAGLRVGIISRGYGGQTLKPEFVQDGTKLSVSGDEARLLADRTHCPVVVGRKRVDALELLLSQHSIDVVLSDDGLQHRALKRDLEIVLVGSKGFGNGWCLPAGPLREPIERLARVDFILSFHPNTGAYHYRYQALQLYNLISLEQKPLASFVGLTVHAVAGIAHPQNFFEMLRQAGIYTVNHPYPDHHQFIAEDLNFSTSDPVIMTEKDASKCALVLQNPSPELDYWVLPIAMQLPPQFDKAFLHKLEEVRCGYKTT